jgi:hypothetical protein
VLGKQVQQAAHQQPRWRLLVRHGLVVRPELHAVTIELLLPARGVASVAREAVAAGHEHALEGAARRVGQQRAQPRAARAVHAAGAILVADDDSPALATRPRERRLALPARGLPARDAHIERDGRRPLRIERWRIGAAAHGVAPLVARRPGAGREAARAISAQSSSTSRGSGSGVDVGVVVRVAGPGARWSGARSRVVDSARRGFGGVAALLIGVRPLPAGGENSTESTIIYGSVGSPTSTSRARRCCILGG